MPNDLINSANTDITQPIQYNDGPLFPLGQVVASPGALSLCAGNNVSPALLIARHRHGDWGDTCEADSESNEQALFEGGRIFSVYIIAGEKLYCITEADRSSTALIRAQDY